MSGSCRLLWSAFVLLSVGCQSLSSDSTALFQLTGDDRPSSVVQATAHSERPRALFGSKGRSDTTAAMADSATRKAAPPSLRFGTGGEEKAGQTAIERLLDNQPYQKPRSSVPTTLESQAQQIILTERKQAAGSVGASTASAPSNSEPDRKLITVDAASGSPSPVDEPTDDLAAPAPAALDRTIEIASAPTAEVAAVPAEQEQEGTHNGGGFIASVFDVFGVGGERAAKDHARATASIQPAGRNQDSEWPDEATDDFAADTPTDSRTSKPPPSVYWQEDLDKLIALLETQVAEQTPGETIEAQERYLRQHVALRMLYLIASRRAEALQAVPDVPRDEQEFWTQIFWALSSTFDEEAMPDSEVRAAETVAQLRAAIRQRESRAALRLEHTRFCQQIDGFGDYVTFAEDRFEAGQPVLIYTEVANFLSEATTDGNFRTVLRSTITIRQQDLNGQIMFQQDLPQTEDKCRSRRSDYFHSYRVQLPATLQPGPHVLILEVTDTLTGRTGRATMNFVVE